MGGSTLDELKEAGAALARAPATVSRVAKRAGRATGHALTTGPGKVAKASRDYARGTYTFYRENPTDFKNEILSGLTVAVMQVPESVAFSFVAGVDPIQGLYSTFCLGFVCAALGGKPAMISGAAGALAVILTDLMSETGPLADRCVFERREYLFAAIVFTGLIQLAIGFLTLGRFVKLLPKSAMLGFMNGLGIIIFKAQLQSFKVNVDPLPPAALNHTLVANITCPAGTEPSGPAITAPCCPDVQFGLDKNERYLTGADTQLWLMLVLVGVTMSCMHFIPKIKKTLKLCKGVTVSAMVVPPSLVGLVLATAIEHGIFRPLDQPTKTVGDVAALSGSPPTWHVPDVPWSDSETYSVIMPYAVSLALVGVIESVMTLQAMDLITETPPSTFRSNQEVLAQGAANLVSGFIRGMGGDAMIGQSTINIMNGARGRLSGMVAGIAILLFIVALSPVIELVPVGALTGVLFMVVIHTFNWPSILILLRGKVPFWDGVVIVMVTVLAVLFDLAIAVGAGVGLSCLVYAWESGMAMTARITVERIPGEPSATRKTYTTRGPLFFASVRTFQEFFDFKNDPEEVHVNFDHSILHDYSALDVVNDVARKYHEEKKRFFVTGLDKQSHRLIRKGRNLGEDIRHDADGNAADEDELAKAEIEVLSGDDVDVGAPLYDYTAEAVVRPNPGPQRVETKL